MRVIEIEMNISAHPHQFTRLHIHLLRDHAQEQGGRPQIKRQSKSDITASLIQHAIELCLSAFTRNMELVSLVARRQSHLVKLCDIPAFDNMATRARTRLQTFDHFGNLIDPLTLFVKSILAIAIGRPIDPLLAIDRPQITPLLGKAFIIGDALNKVFKRD